ncbi:MAG: hypothetical protein LR011_06480 [Verrucomicrobia bacterium]|nr:hypothetical protein [Verrucomicrobiota bacterium]
MLNDILQRGGYVVLNPPNLPYEPFRNSLYSRDELFNGFRDADPCSYCEAVDARVYSDWKLHGGAVVSSFVHGMFQRIHDQSITDALHEFLDEQDCRKVVAVMGGHSMRRTDARYRDVVYLSRALTKSGYLLVSGGGPGAMEATHLGAFLAHVPDPQVDGIIEFLSQAPSYRDLTWLSSAFQVIRRITGGSHESGISLAIPTWHYGHEPPTPFASHIAKYFSNSIREEGLITVAMDGIIFAPGSAGTIQEIFQDATQNHYVSTGYASPMVFLDRTFWTQTKPVYPLVKQLAGDEPYAQLIGISDSIDEIISFLESHPRIPVSGTQWDFCSQFCQSKE